MVMGQHEFIGTEHLLSLNCLRAIVETQEQHASVARKFPQPVNALPFADSAVAQEDRVLEMPSPRTVGKAFTRVEIHKRDTVRPCMLPSSDDLLCLRCSGSGERKSENTK